ncbi:MAG: DUF1640 domain-containing protein [Magnetococcales bacterium]|nr:DUF1640 domain-containing protein [Magnetococcales bacterium]MBF0157577.1 DUF1640 domain-containing protein [Magnetococcales bacterium]
MTTAIAFDTHKFIRRLRDAGVEERQAEAFSEALREAQETRLQDLATKADLDAKFEKELSPIRIDLAVIKWMLGVLMAGVIALILKSFFPH